MTRKAVATIVCLLRHLAPDLPGQGGSEMKGLTPFVVALLLFLPSQVLFAVDLPFSDGFESYTAGSPPPAPWENEDGGPMAVSTTLAHTGEKSIEGYGYQSELVTLEPDYPDLIEYEGWISCDGNEGIIGFHEQMSNMLFVFKGVHLVCTDMQTAYAFFQDSTSDPSQIQLVSGLTAGWHHVKTRLNFVTLRANVWIDDVLRLAEHPIGGKNVTVPGYGSRFLDQIGVSNYFYGATFFDDLAFREFTCEPENCSNDIDDDCDGSVDGDDSDCAYPGPANAEASTYGARSLNGSGAANGLALLLIPVSAILAPRGLQRKK